MSDKMRWIVALLLTLTLAACGGESAPQEQSPSSSSAQPTPQRFPRTGLGINPANGKTGVFIEVMPGVGIDPSTGHVGPVFSFGP